MATPVYYFWTLLYLALTKKLLLVFHKIVLFPIQEAKKLGAADYVSIFFIAVQVFVRSVSLLRYFRFSDCEKLNHFLLIYLIW